MIRIPADWPLARTWIPIRLDIVPGADETGRIRSSIKKMRTLGIHGDIPGLFRMAIHATGRLLLKPRCRPHITVQSNHQGKRFIWFQSTGCKDKILALHTIKSEGFPCVLAFLLPY
jgi:hypothetical protein